MHFEELLFAAVLILGIVAVSVAIFKRLAMGAILGFLAAGVIVGPSGFAVTDRVEELRHITELGVVLHHNPAKARVPETKISGTHLFHCLAEGA